MPTPMTGGSTTTAGGLVFTGDQHGNLYAFDAATGKVLWEHNVGLAFGSAPIVYSIKGREYVVAAVGGGALTAIGRARRSRVPTWRRLKFGREASADGAPLEASCAPGQGTARRGRRLPGAVQRLRPGQAVAVAGTARVDDGVEEATVGAPTDAPSS